MVRIKLDWGLSTLVLPFAKAAYDLRESNQIPADYLTEVIRKTLNNALWEVSIPNCEGGWKYYYQEGVLEISEGMFYGQK